MTHLVFELVKQAAGVDIAHIPYKGTGPAVIDIAGGQIQMMFASGLSLTPHIKSGRVRALGVTTPQRSRLLPGVPTLAETGLAGVEMTGWYGLLTPAGTPREIIAALNREIVQVLRQPDIRAKFAGDGSEPAPGTPEDFRALIHRDIEAWTRLFERTKLKL